MPIKKATTPVCLALLFFLIAIQEFAAAHPVQDGKLFTDAPLLWRIEGKKPSFLFGTIHIPDVRVLALHPMVTNAFDASDAVYLEIPMGFAEMAKIQQAARFGSNRTLRDIIPADLFRRIEALVRSKGMTIDPFERMKIWFVISTITLLDYLPALTTTQPLDLFLYHKANRRGKEVGGLETVEEQVRAFEEFSIDEQAEFLRTTLEQIERGDNPVERLVKLYLAGDVESLSVEIGKQMTRDEALAEKLRRVLLTERDKRLADRIETKLREGPDKSFFFAIGAAHLSEKDSVLVWLRKKGFVVKRVTEPKGSEQLGSRFQVPGSKFQVPSSGSLRTEYVPNNENLELGIWNLELRNR